MRVEKPRGWSKIASAMWGPIDDPQIYGDLEVDATEMLAFIEAAREQTGAHVTLTHLAGRAVAHALVENPKLNGHMFLGRFLHYDAIDVFFVTFTGEGRELSGVKVNDADQKTAVEVAREVSERVDRVRHDDKDPEFGRAKDVINLLPSRILRSALGALTTLASDLGLDLSKLGLARRSFGSAMVTSVGMFGIEHAYAPLSRYYRVPAVILVNEVRKRPVVDENDEVVVRPMLTFSATMDHRLIDGYQAGRLSEAISEYCADPWRFEPDIAPPEAS